MLCKTEISMLCPLWSIIAHLGGDNIETFVWHPPLSSPACYCWRCRWGSHSQETWSLHLQVVAASCTLPPLHCLGNMNNTLLVLQQQQHVHNNTPSPGTVGWCYFPSRSPWIHWMATELHWAKLCNDTKEAEMLEVAHWTVKLVSAHAWSPRLLSLQGSHTQQGRI